MELPPEKLGSFYIGSEYDIEKDESLGIPLNYDARDLTTHAVCFGMTGSGKTGLCIGILEEAALDKVPAIIIDPKGDITNLLLQFPEMRSEDFRPWINPDDARRKGMGIDEYAGYISKKWEDGLKEWGIGRKRIEELKNSVDFSIYTPGSNAGREVSVLSGLKPPDVDFQENAENIREQINGTVAALLGLIGIDADPLRSKEAILLSNIFEHYWSRGEGVDITTLITSIQSPPFRNLGVFELDAYYPEDERFELAMALNSLVASPSFVEWLQGDELDIGKMLYKEDGSPRHSIFYLAHLSDEERMFFVTLLLENVLTWIRKQSGTTSLRALLYFDEIYGFMPPVAKPPSKGPLMTLVKQARAFGLGLMMVTQNPVDIDYKGLTNIGTWFIGKLQAERDKEKVLSGLRGTLSPQDLERGVDFSHIIDNLKSRIFLMHNVHEDGPIVFNTRWVMSYLRGPMTRPQLKELMSSRDHGMEEEMSVAPSPSKKRFEKNPSVKPLPTLSPDMDQVFLPITVDERSAVRELQRMMGDGLDADDLSLHYVPNLIGYADVRFIDKRRGLSDIHEVALLADPQEHSGPIEWDEALEISIGKEILMDGPDDLVSGSVFYTDVPEDINSAKKLNAFKKDFSDWLYYNKRVHFRQHKDLKVYQEQDESEREFLARLQQTARERRDGEIDDLEDKYAKKLDKLTNKLEGLELDLESDKAEYDARKREEMVGVGESALSFFLGRRRTSSISTITRKRRLTAKAKHNIKETTQDIEDVKEDISQLESELKMAIGDITKRWDSVLEGVTDLEVRPRRADVDVRRMAIAWTPYWKVDGEREEIAAFDNKK